MSDADTVQVPRWLLTELRTRIAAGPPETGTWASGTCSVDANTIARIAAYGGEPPPDMPEPEPDDERTVSIDHYSLEPMGLVVHCTDVDTGRLGTFVVEGFAVQAYFDAMATRFPLTRRMRRSDITWKDTT